MTNRLLFLLRYYLAVVLIFIAAQVVFMLCYAGQESFTVGDVLDVVWHGLSLNLSTSLYVIIVPFLLTFASAWAGAGRWFRVSMRVYNAIIAILMALAFVADTSLYSFWHFKLDASCLQYLETPTEAMASVTWGYLIKRIIIWAIASFLIYLSLCRGILYVCPNKHPKISAKATTIVTKIKESAIYVGAVPLIILGIRGGLGESTTNVGQVYFSQNQFLNHSAVNPVFSFLSSLGKSGDYIVEYEYMSDEDCAAMTDSLFFTDSQDSDTLLTTSRPNIVLIIMESCGGQFTAIGGHDEITPRINQMAREGVSFAECYANSWRTDKGVVSILSGYPAFPITSIMKVPEKSRNLPSIAAALDSVGYSTAFFYGGDINFTNMRSYVMSSGYQRLRWMSDYPSDWQSSAQWGVRDDLMFASLLEDIKREKARPWMKTLLTLSSHEPWDVPDHVLDDEVHNAFHYLDRCVGAFVDSLRQMPAWDNTLVIILPDHGFRYQGINEATRLYNHIPLLWVGGAVKRPYIINKVCAQSDLAATLLGQLGIPHDRFRFSRDVLSSKYQHPVALHTFNNGFTVIDSTAFTAFDLDSETTVASQHIDGSEASDSLRDSQLHLGRALLQLFSKDLKDL